MIKLVQVIVFLLNLSAIIDGQNVSINWNKVIGVSKTVPTFQVVVNPLLERKNKVHDRVFKGLKELNATHVRLQLWIPYPKLAVAELEPPTANSTSWNFTLIDPIVEDFMAAQEGREVVMDFSTQPAWLYKTKERVPYPDDPDQVYWKYTEGTELVDPSGKQLGDYYERFVRWYVKGGFTDELGVEHKSGHHYKFQYFEVFNEIDIDGHKSSPEDYNKQYDVIVKAVQKVAPETKFIGLALGIPDNCLNTFFPHFLNHSNHSPNTPLDGVSYHRYASCDPNDDINTMQKKFFQQGDQFLNVVVSVEKIRKELSPETKTMINELGTMHENTVNIQKEYWNLSGALFAYEFARMCLLGIDFVGMSQLVGYPSQYPSVSMVDWNSGALNARAMTLKLLIMNFGNGDQMVDTLVNNEDVVYGAGYVTKGGQKKLLLINKTSGSVRVELSEVAKSSMFIDVNTGDQLKTEKLDKNSIQLGGFAVHVVEF